MYLTHTDEQVSDMGIRAGRLRTFPSGTVLLAMYGSIGTVSIAAVPTTTNQAIVGIECGPNLDPEYLWFYLKHVRSDLASLGRGGTQSNINAAMVRDLRIDAPSGSDQRRIASRLSLAMRVMNQAEELTDRRLAMARELRDKVRETAFDALAAVDRGPIGRTGVLADGDWILAADYEPSGVRLFQVGDVGRGHLLAKSSRFISHDRAIELQCSFLRPGDILIARMPDPIGRACVVPDLDDKAITAVDVTIFRPDPELLDADYAVQFMNSPSWFRAVDAKASGATRARISRRNLEQTHIPLPDLATQKEVAANLRQRLAAVDDVENALRVEQQGIAALPAALLRRTFGELAA